MDVAQYIAATDNDTDIDFTCAVCAVNMPEDPAPMEEEAPPLESTRIRYILKQLYCFIYLFIVYILVSAYGI